VVKNGSQRGRKWSKGGKRKREPLDDHHCCEGHCSAFLWVAGGNGSLTGMKGDKGRREGKAYENPPIGDCRKLTTPILNLRRREKRMKGNEEEGGGRRELSGDQTGRKPSITPQPKPTQ
jgi:hypothetical protein